MCEFIYKYMSFPMFVDMVQNQTLNFSLPSCWDDPYENEFLRQWIDSLSYPHSLYAYLLQNRVFAQSWTKLAENDSMWRIYSFEKKSLRIKVRMENITKLGGIIVEPVTYSDKIIDYSQNQLSKMNVFIKLMAQKRTAFKHEEEIRLFYIEGSEIKEIPQKFGSAILAAKIFSGSNSFDMSSVDYDRIKSDLEYLNCVNRKTHKKVSFSMVPDFIGGVMVNPFASSWYIDTVRKYCEINNISFEGKSKLYEVIS